MPSSPDAVSTIERLLEEARGGLVRVSPAEALAQAKHGAVLVDIRSELQRRRDGNLPGAKYVPRNVLEWRLDPSSPHRDPEAARRDVPVIIICDELPIEPCRGDDQAVRPRRDRCHRWLPGLARRGASRGALGARVAD